MNRESERLGRRKPEDRRASARGRRGKTPWGRYLGRSTARGGCETSRAAKPPEVLPLPAAAARLPPAPGSAPGRSRDRGWGRPPHVPGSRAPGRVGGALGLRGGLPRLLPSWRGGGRRGAGWEAPGAAAGSPPPPAAPGAGRPRLRRASGSSLRGLSLPAGRRGWGRQAGSCGPGWRRGLAGRCFRGGPDPSPRPSPPIRGLPLPPRASLVSCRRPLP